uniref:Polysaccharide biosynthesis tyrosine autokinase n=1 Tax=candidate division WOR-3 bacterium TaxID=2052148 RepID=A0A7C4U9D2_UNCW3
MDEERVDLEHYIMMLKRKFYVFLSIFFISLVYSFIYYFRTPEIYRTTASIFVVKKSINIFSPYTFQGIEEKDMVDHTLLLKSNMVIKMVSEALTDEELSRANLSSKEEAYKRLLWDYSNERIVIEPFRNSSIIKINVTEENPYRAYYFANYIAQCYRDFDIENQRRQVSSLKEFTRSQLLKMEKVLKESEERLKEYKMKHKTFDISQETREIINKLTSFEAEYQNLYIEKIGLEEKIKSIDSSMTQEQKKFVETKWISLLPIVEELGENLSELETQLSNMVIQGLKEDDPKVISIKNRIKSTQNEMRQKVEELFQSKDISDPIGNIREMLKNTLFLKIDLAVNDAKMNAYKNIIDDYQKKLLLIPEREIELARLEREANANEKIYMMLLEKAEEASITEASEIGNILVLDPAPLNTTPLKGVKVRRIIFYLFVGLSLGIVFTILADYLDISVKSEEDVNFILKIPLYGIIPKIQNNKGNVFDEHKKSLISEPFRTLRTNIILSDTDEKKTILITSIREEEGKSFVASNLALSFILSDKKVLLIDADFRKPQIHRFCGVEKEPGLSDYLSGNVKDVPIIKKEKLFILASGSSTPNPTELLDSKKMREFMRNIKKDFDIVIIDSPPIFTVADTMIISNMTDKTILVVRYSKTPKILLQRLKMFMNNKSIKIDGYVLNAVNLSRGYRYYYYYKDYYTKR